MVAEIEACSSGAVVDVGVLTRGKATLGIALTSLLLQEDCPVRVHIVDTGDSPVVNRDDVTLAMRLAFDRGIPCSYERVREPRRGFSLGRSRLLKALRGPHVCLVDDDTAFGSLALGRLLRSALSLPEYGCVSPACRNSTVPLGWECRNLAYTPGSLFFLDRPLRDMMLRYYSSTVDIVDALNGAEKVWEVAFISELLTQLRRPCLSEPGAVIYHLDYQDLQMWNLFEGTIIRRSARLAREMVAASPRPDFVAV